MPAQGQTPRHQGYPNAAPASSELQPWLALPFASTEPCGARMLAPRGSMALSLPSS